MAKVILFSRQFPKYHPRAGQATYFVEAFYKSQFLMKVIPKELEETYSQEAFINGFTKAHTIRSGNRFKKGDFFSPRVWSGKPYRSKQIIIAPNTEVLKTWDFEITKSGITFINNEIVGTHPKRSLETIAANDGLTRLDLAHWFNVLPFKGQIICWNPNINY